MMKILNKLKGVWDYMWTGDDLLAYVLLFCFGYVLFHYVLYPSLSFLLATQFPIVAIVSGSMEHRIIDGYFCNQFIFNQDGKVNFETFWQYCGDNYKEFGITQEEFGTFDYQHGMNIGDVVLVYGKDASAIEVGDIVIFRPQEELFFITKGPVIHRVVSKYEENGELYFRTMGDYNGISKEGFENKIPAENVFGVAFVRVPYLGYPRLLLSKLF